MKTFRVRMLAFGQPGQIREVDVPDDQAEGPNESVVEEVFYWGQNDVQSKPMCSVSMGDVAEMGDEFYLFSAVGTRKITAEQLAAYEALSRRDRFFCTLLNNNM